MASSQWFFCNLQPPFLKNSLQFVSADPIVNNNELYGAETVYVESGKVETVQFKFNDMGRYSKKNERN